MEQSAHDPCNFIGHGQAQLPCHDSLSSLNSLATFPSSSKLVAPTTSPDLVSGNKALL